MSGAVYKITVGRDDLSIKDMGAAINSRMARIRGRPSSARIQMPRSPATWQSWPRGATRLESPPADGLDVVAIHEHMTTTQPTIYFLHYWETRPTAKLATGFKAALDQLGKK